MTELRNFLSTSLFGVSEVMLELFLVIGNRLTGFFDETEFKMIVMFIAKIEEMGLGLAAPRMTAIRHRRMCLALHRSRSFGLILGGRRGGFLGCGFFRHFLYPPQDLDSLYMNLIGGKVLNFSKMVRFKII